MDTNSNTGLIVLAFAIVIASFIIGLSIRSGMTRSAAISSGVSPHTYADWMTLANN